MPENSKESDVIVNERCCTITGIFVKFRRLIFAIIPNMMRATPSSGLSIWLILYFIFSLLLTIYNKAVMQLMKFSFPWILTAIHTLCGWIGCRILLELGMFTPTRLSTKQLNTIRMFSILYTANIAVSNISLNLVTVPVRDLHI
jgi:hypothetical protein